MRRRLPVIEATLLAQAVAELNRIGNNLNQTARALNELRLIGIESGNDRLARVIDDMREVNQDALRDLKVTMRATREAAGYDREG